MALVVTHSTVATLPDEAGKEVNKNEWNDAHVITGAGTMATETATDYLAKAGNLSGLANTGTSRTNLGVVIGTNVQAYSANLDEYAAVNPTAAGLALLDDADADAQIVTLSAVKNTSTNGNVSFKSAALATTATTGFVMIPSCAGVPTGVPAAIPTGQIPEIFDSVGADMYAYIGGAWVPSSPGVDTANSPAANEFARFTDADTIEGRTTTEVKSDLGLVIGTNVQAFSANLDEYAAVNPTAAGLALLDDAAASDQRTTLGLGTLATQSGTFSGTSSGTNTGDQTNISGNAATVTTNANLTGPVTSTGNATAIASPMVIDAINGSTAADGDLTLQGTSNATRDSSYVLLQPNGGNVGIGTTTASFLFTLVATVPVINLLGNATSDGTISSVRFANGADDSVVQLNALRSGANDAGAFSVQTQPTGGSLTERFRINPDGNFGIGTTAPDKVLEVNLGTASALRLTYNDANGSAVTYMDTTVSSAGLTTFTGAGSAPTFTFAQDVSVPDEAYGVGWNGSLEVPTKNAVYDKIETVSGGLSDGDKGDITVSASGATWTVDAAVVTLAKMANLAQDQVIMRTTASTGVPETATITAAARTVLDDATVGAMLATLGGHIAWTFTAAGADAAPAMAVNTFYTCDISGYTADRTATLPAVAAVGDRIGIYITEGDTAFEMLITATAGDTLNLVAGGTEWSRLFIRNEFVVMRCTVANTTWVVEQDQRIAQQAVMRLSTAATAEVATTWTSPTAKSGVWTADIDVGSISAVATDKMTVRRASNYILSGASFANAALADQKYFGVSLFTATVGDLPTINIVSVSGAVQPRVPTPLSLTALAAGDNVNYQFISEEGSRGLGITSSFFSIRESI